MDTNTKLDNLLKDCLEISDKPSSKMVFDLKHELRKGELEMNRLNQGRSARRLSGSAVAAIVALLVLTTSLVAAWYLTSFERLEELIGQEQAGVLQPVESGTVIEVDGIRVEVIATGVFYNVVDVYLTLQDLEGNRLDPDMHTAGLGSWHLSTHVQAGDAMMTLGHAPKIIDRSDDGVITMHLRSHFDSEVTGKEITFRIFDITFTTFFADNYNTNINLQDILISEPNTIHVTTEQLLSASSFSSRLAGTGLSWTDPETFVKAVPNGMNVLEPHQQNIRPLDIDGIDMVVSAAAIIDGRLHLQIYNPTTCGPALFMLKDANMYNVPMFANLAFITTETGSFMSPDDVMAHFFTLSEDERMSFDFHYHYSEGIFEVDLDRLSEYQLFAFASLFERVEFNWDIALEIENLGYIAAQFELEYRPDCVVLYEVKINSMTTIISGGLLDLRGMGTGYCEYGRVLLFEISEYQVSSFVGIWPEMWEEWGLPRDGSGRLIPIPEVRIHTTNGIFETTQFKYLRPGGSEFVITFTNETLIDIDSVVAVSINGEKISF